MDHSYCSSSSDYTNLLSLKFWLQIIINKIYGNNLDLQDIQHTAMSTMLFIER